MPLPVCLCRLGTSKEIARLMRLICCWLCNVDASYLAFILSAKFSDFECASPVLGAKNQSANKTDMFLLSGCNSDGLCPQERFLTRMTQK